MPRLLSFQTLEVSKNQLRQVIAVAAFENAERRNAQLANRFAEPMVIFRLQGFLGNRVARIGIETGRDGEQSRFAASFIKLADGTVQRVGQDVEGVFGTKISRQP